MKIDSKPIEAGGIAQLATGRITMSHSVGPDGHPLRPIAGIQISLRLPPAILAKLTRLSDRAVQTKSQFIIKLISEMPESVAH